MLKKKDNIFAFIKKKNELISVDDNFEINISIEHRLQPRQQT